MSRAIKRRRGTTAEHAAFTGLAGEITVDTDKKTLVVHDGATAGGTPLAKETHTTPAASDTSPGHVELATTAEHITGADGTRAATPAGVKAVADLKLSLTGGTMTGDLTVRATSDSAYRTFNLSRRRAADADTQNGDALGVFSANGRCGGNDTSLAYFQFNQTTAVSGGSAGARVDLMVKGGTQGNANRYFQFDGENEALHLNPDNTISLGSASLRASEVFAAAGTINTSDANDKTNITDIPPGLIAAFWQARPRIFQWIQAVEEKGAEAARLHTGYIAQEWAAALEAEGLDPVRYALYCADALVRPVFEEREVDGVMRMVQVGEEPVLDAENNQVYRLGLRYSLITAIMDAAYRARMDGIEARLDALEA